MSNSSMALDVPYTRHFYPELTPAWLDHAAVLSGIKPPERANGFTWCDLGCGQGVTAALLAANHPTGRFVGLDLMAAHIDHAQGLAAALGIGNVAFHRADFANPPPLPDFDYIVAHGVYTWIDGPAQDAFRALIDRHLKPGGLVYLSYNAMPGCGVDVPFQALITALGQDLPGNSADRFVVAADMVRRLAAAGAPTLGGTSIAGALNELLARKSPGYLAHEYMVAGWRPLFVTEVRAALAPLGLIPAGSAILSDFIDGLVLPAAARQTLSAINDPNQRELARDFVLNRRFRRDVFSRGGPRLDAAERAGRLAKTRYALVLPEDRLRAALRIPVGLGSFETPGTGAVVTALSRRPQRLSALSGIAAALGAAPGDGAMLDAVVALCAAGAVRPVEPDPVAIDRFTAVVRDRIDGPDELQVLASSWGTGLAIDAATLRSLAAGSGVAAGSPAWQQLLRSHGLPFGL
ncbi:MAG: class I SAM-dependent methyltransferase [Azospirillaceae bacterium]|nr:class I SAM-dependent methyltransferase [Azospirillaceae bacterium]